MSQKSRITILVDNNSAKADLETEHGLALWIEYKDKRILFDTGQSNLLLQNAEKLGVNLVQANAIVLSHGHYDHTGGLTGVIELAQNAVIYSHPEAAKPRYSCKEAKSHFIGISEPAKKAIAEHKVIWTEKPFQLCTQVTLTGQIPRTNDFEDVGGAFFVDENCHTPDSLIDDMAMFIESSDGLIVIFGCAHSGVVNTLDYISKLTGCNKIYAVIGGMHLLNANPVRVANTIETFQKYRIQKIIPLHCTGQKAAQNFKSVLGDRCLFLGAGSQINFDN